MQTKNHKKLNPVRVFRDQKRKRKWEGEMNGYKAVLIARNSPFFVLRDSGGRRRRRNRSICTSLNTSGGHGCSRNRVCGSLIVGAIPRDVAGLRALVADLTSGAQRATVGGRAIARDVTLKSTSVC